MSGQRGPRQRPSIARCPARDRPDRQWVLTVPHRLRYRLAFDHALCRPACSSAQCAAGTGGAAGAPASRTARAGRSPSSRRKPTRGARLRPRGRPLRASDTGPPPPAVHPPRPPPISPAAQPIAAAPCSTPPAAPAARRAQPLTLPSYGRRGPRTSAFGRYVTWPEKGRPYPLSPAPGANPRFGRSPPPRRMFPTGRTSTLRIEPVVP